MSSNFLKVQRAVLFIVLGISQDVFAEQGIGTYLDPITGGYVTVSRDWVEGVFLDPSTGNYRVVYKGSSDTFNEVIFVPSTKIDPIFSSRVAIIRDGTNFEYRYKLRSSSSSVQNIRIFVVGVGGIDLSMIQSPVEWVEVIFSDTDASAEMQTVSWMYSGDRHPGGISPGEAVGGFSFNSSALPGVGSVSISGAAPITGWLDEFPSVGPVGQQMYELGSRNHVVRFAAVPRISVPDPYSSSAVLENIRAHVLSDVVRYKLIDTGFSSRLDDLFKSAISIAKTGSKKELAASVRDLRQAIQSASPGVDAEGDWEDGAGSGKMLNRLIDPMAARILFFDIKYVEGRL